MNRVPKLSIITVTFNSEDYLEETLQSVLQQKYEDYEYIVIDGKSEDQTIDIVRRYLQPFAGRLRYISESDQGIYDAMNKGIEMATGEYIGMINSDDKYTPDAFIKVAECIENGHSDVIYSDLNLIDLDGKKIGCLLGDASKLNRGMTVNHPTCFVKREVYKKFGTYDLQYSIVADYDFVLRIYNKGATFFKASTSLADFRVGGTSSNNYRSVIEKYKVQRKYYSVWSCLYVWTRGVVRCKLLEPIRNRAFRINSIGRRN